MKKLFYIGLMALLAFSLIGCKSQKPTMTKETTVRDSISTTVQIVPRDTVVNVPGDSLKIKVKLNELTPIPTERKSASGKVTAKVSRPDKDNILVECNTDRLELIIELKDKIINTLKQRDTNTVETIYVTEKYTPLWKNVLAGFGILFIALILGLVGAKFIKP